MTMDKEDFIKNVREHLPIITDQDLKLIVRAYDFAKTAHDSQLRANGKPYFE